ncbi:DUF7619 domain-containing protein [Pontibacter sp. MBLB2868]|uniref:DUF7619 domain-containing protein n=1 Tax=Pontibacter sp. MBLB2868 TaxID=3451555 RepID=UPI003F74F0F0
MYVTSHNTNALTKYNSDGKILYQIKEAGKEKGKLWKPNDVALDASGFVYVTDINGKRIQKLSPDGLFLEEYGTYALNEENKYVRSSIAADAFGNVLLSSNYTIKPVYYSIKGTPQYQLPVKTNSLAFSQDGKYLITADPFLDKIDIYETNIVSEYNYVHGKVYADFNANCIADASEIGISKILIKAEPGPFYAITDKAGNYQLLVEAGSYNVAPIINETNRTGVLIDQSCAIGNDPLPVQFSNTGNLLLSNNFGAKVTLSPYLSTSISSTRRRRCFESTTKVTYSNSGFAPAENAKVHVQLPEQIEFLSADKPYTRLADGTYVFDVGTVAAGQNSVITIQDKVKCGDEGIRGLTVCTKVWITDSKPLPPAATTIITGKCNPETGYVRFALKNIGQLSMDTGELFRIYLDGQLATIETYRLATGDSLVLWIPTGGKTVRLEADQPDGNGENKQASVTVEACQNTNTPAPVPFSTGFVNAMPTDDEEAKVSVECLPITDSYDPNDKLVSPIGLTEENYTPMNAALKYKIRFQNTGTDVAYRVVLVDTLSENLDLSTLQMGSASHPYRFDVSGKGKPVLTWTFDNIMLPDSTSNEPGSHGFIQFSIKPKADLPEKTTVENFADIFFDFNSPVRTNTTLNRIFDMPPVVNEEVRLDADQIIASPSITDFTPAAGKFGEEIILAGKNFSSTPEQNKVYFNGTLATVVSASATELKVLVPASATTGNLKVITPDGGAQAPESFEVYQPPVVREFSPIEGIVGSTVTIEGNSLTTDWLQSISLGSETCEIISATGTTAVVKVPQGAVSGKFEIITKGGEVNSTKQFVVWHQPVISGLSSYLDKVGATITISGENFASEALRNIVLFEKVQAQVLESSATQLKVRVPAGVSIANVAVETPGGKATTPKPFEVIPAPVLFSFSPASGPVGTEVTLVGENFLAIGIQDTLTLNGDKVQLLSSASDKFTIRIPRGASTGKVKVAGIGGYSVSTTDFVVEELSAEEAIEVYPNPSTGHFTIRFVHADFDIQSVQVYTSVGRLIHTQPVSSPRPENLEVDITKAKAGMYILRIQTDRGLILKKLNVL